MLKSHSIVLATRFGEIGRIASKEVTMETESGLGLESGLKSILLDLDLDTDLGRFVTKSTFNFHCGHRRPSVRRVWAGARRHIVRPRVQLVYLSRCATTTGRPTVVT